MRGGDLQDVHKTHPPSLKHSFPPSLLPSFLPSLVLGPGGGGGDRERGVVGGGAGRQALFLWAWFFCSWVSPVHPSVFHNKAAFRYVSLQSQWFISQDPLTGEDCFLLTVSE